MKNSRIIKDIMLKTFVFNIASYFLKGQTVAILRYHAIVKPENNFYASPSIALSPEIFEEHVKYFAQNFNIISLDTVKTCIETGAPFPERAIVFTFDDGYKDNFIAYKILKKYNATGTFYIVASCIDNNSVLWLFEVNYLLKHTFNSSIKLSFKGMEMIFPLGTEFEREVAIEKIMQLIKSNTLFIREEIRAQIRNQTSDVKDFKNKTIQVMLSWEQVKEMSDNGMTIGGHTLTHLNLPNAGNLDANMEIVESKNVIESMIGKEVLHFSYPNGGPYDYYNETIKDLVNKAGFITSTTSNNGVVNHSSDLFELNRVRVSPYLSEIVYQVCMEPIL